MRSLVLVALGIALATAAVAQEAEPSEHRTYDAAALQVRWDEAGPVLGYDFLQPRPRPGDPEESGYPRHPIASLLRESVARASWEDERDIKAQAGALYITQTAAVHARIRSLLGALRARRGLRLTLELMAVRGAPAALAPALAGGPVLDTQRLAALERGRVAWRERLSLESGVQGFLARTRRAPVVYELGPDGARLRTLTLGRVAEVRAALASDRRSLLVSLRSDEADSEAGRFETGMAVAPALDQPRLRQRCVRTSVWLPARGAALVGAQRDGDELELLVVRHVATVGGRPAAWLGNEGECAQRLFDARFAGFDRREAELPPLAPPLEDDEGDWYHTIEPLVDGVQRTIAADSWEVEWVGIGSYQGHLLVTHTPDVLREVEAYLRRAERERARSIAVRVRLLRARGEVGRALATGEADALVAAADTGHASLTVVDELALATLVGQRGVVCDLRDRPLVRSYVGSPGGRRPRVALTRAGRSASVRVLQGKDAWRVGLRLERASLEGVQVFETGGLRLQLPRIARRAHPLTLWLRDGGAEVVSLGEGLHALVQLHVSQPAKEKHE